MSNMTNIPSNVSYPKQEKAYALLAQESVPFHQAVVGVTYPNPSYHIDRPQNHSINVFEYVAEGEGDLLLDGVWRRVRAGQVYLLRAGEEHHYRADPQNPWKKFWINYNADYLLAMLDAYEVTSGIYPCEEAKQYFDQAFQVARLGGTYAESGRTVADCVHRIVACCAATRVFEKRTDEYRIREELNAAIYRRLELDTLADKLHMSKSNLIRVFRKHYGVTPYEYLLSSKIEVAKLLLSTTHLPIREIAVRLCITDEHYFSSLFSKRTGLSPRAFRQQAMKSGG